MKFPATQPARTEHSARRLLLQTTLKGVSMYQTNMYEGMLAETIMIHGLHASRMRLVRISPRPLGAGPFSAESFSSTTCPAGTNGIVRPHAAHRGYAALCPNLYRRAGHGSPEDVAAKVQNGRWRCRQSGCRRPARSVASLALAALCQRQSRYLRHLFGWAPCCLRQISCARFRGR